MDGKKKWEDRYVEKTKKVSTWSYVCGEVHVRKLTYSEWCVNWISLAPRLIQYPFRLSEKIGKLQFSCLTCTYLCVSSTQCRQRANEDSSIFIHHLNLNSKFQTKQRATFIKFSKFNLRFRSFALSISRLSSTLLTQHSHPQTVNLNFIAFPWTSKRPLVSTRRHSRAAAAAAVLNDEWRREVETK